MRAYMSDKGLFWLTDGDGRDLATAGSQDELELKMAALGVRLSGKWWQIGFCHEPEEPDSPAFWQADVVEEQE